jgi:signal transduction histidine kinase
MAAFTVAVFLLMLIASAGQLALSGLAVGNPVNLGRALMAGWQDTFSWLLWIPLILVISRQFPLGGTKLWRRLPVHLVAALAVAMFNTFLQVRLADTVIFIRAPPPASVDPDTLQIPPPPQAKSSFETLTAVPDRRELDVWGGLGMAFTSRGMIHLLTYAVIVVLWQGMEAQRRARERERHAAELSRRVSEARLQALRQQLQPHFLFNTLNAIVSHVHENPDVAEEMLTQLAALLRRILGDTGGHQIRLSEELAVLDQYLAIHQVRFGERLTIRRDIDDTLLDCPVPSLLLQPLVENAIQHGIARMSGPGEIQIAVQRDARALVIRVRDNGPGPDPAHLDRGGVGLDTTRGRLEVMYEGRASLDLERDAEGGTVVHVRLPLEPRGERPT